jgi:hypothetical protein
VASAGSQHETVLARHADRIVRAFNRRREFVHATPLEVKVHLAELAGELLQFQETPEALEYRQCMAHSASPAAS